VGREGSDAESDGTHQHASSSARDAGIPQAAQHQREIRQPEVSFRLAAAGREEQQIHPLPVGAFGVYDAFEVHQNEGNLEWKPLRLRDRSALPGCVCHCAVSETKGQQSLRIITQEFNAAFNPPRCRICIIQKNLRRRPPLGL
jgi:hypothetical protein